MMKKIGLMSLCLPLVLSHNVRALGGGSGSDDDSVQSFTSRASQEPTLTAAATDREMIMSVHRGEGRVRLFSEGEKKEEIFIQLDALQYATKEISVWIGPPYELRRRMFAIEIISHLCEEKGTKVTVFLEKQVSKEQEKSFREALFSPCLMGKALGTTTIKVEGVDGVEIPRGLNVSALPEKMTEWVEVESPAPEDLRITIDDLRNSEKLNPKLDKWKELVGRVEIIFVPPYDSIKKMSECVRSIDLRGRDILVWLGKGTTEDELRLFLYEMALGEGGLKVEFRRVEDS